MRGAPGTISSVEIGSGGPSEVLGNVSDRLVRRRRLSECSSAVATGEGPTSEVDCRVGRVWILGRWISGADTFDDRRPSPVLQVPPPISPGSRSSPPALLPGAWTRLSPRDA